MALISNQIDGLYGGVNQQSADSRLITQVEEMVNAYPTLNSGLLRRNPTRKIALTSDITYTKEMWSYVYDRGLNGIESEQYAINIHSGNLEIINLQSGRVYKENDGLIFVGNAKNYLFPFGGINGYSATTIKDTTFLVNKTAIPRLKDHSVGTPAVVNMKTATIGVLSYTYTYINSTVTRTAPYGIVGFNTLANGYTTIMVDNNIMLVSSIHFAMFAPSIYSTTKYDDLIPYSSYISKVIETLSSSLDSTLYRVDINANNNITITRTDGQAIAVSISISSKTSDGVVGSVPPVSDYWGSITYSSADKTKYEPTLNYKRDGFVWIKSSNSANAYTYNVTVKDTNGNIVTASTTKTTTDAAATELATQINNNASFSATSIGSVIKIIGNSDLVEVNASDSWGNQASFGWHDSVASTTDLPKNLGYENSIVKIIGNGTSTFATYWLKYSDGLWRETQDPSRVTIIDADTMPHILTRNSDDTFTLSAYDKWASSQVGDEESNPVPSFIATDINKTPVIKDIFFFKNRLGFITNRTVIMSEVGVYGNFWRTTTAALLDSDYIDATVDTTEVISLEYALYLEDSVVIFSDKAQFKIEGGKVLSPKDIQISKTSSYDINTLVRPVFMNDKIFFCSKRGDYTAVMQYAIATYNNASVATDITAHAQYYIPRGVVRLYGNAINNMLFLVSGIQYDTVYVYKYYDNADTRIQSAWFKWTYNGSIYSAFSVGNNLDLLINRKNRVAATNWVVGNGIWDNSKLWDNSQVWVMSPASLTSVNQLETSEIFPQDYTKEFLDDYTTDDNKTIIPTTVTIGEWVPSTNNIKDIRCHLKFKTIQISSEPSSEFGLVVNDIARNTTRTIQSKYTVNRKPMIYGDANNIRISIVSSEQTGFKINTVSYEGSITKRDTRR